MKLCILSLLAVLVAGLSGSEAGSKGPRPDAVPGTTANGLLTFGAVPINRSFRCPVTLSAANGWTAATTVPSGMAFALSSFTLTDSSGPMLQYNFNIRRYLRVVGGLCVETMAVPSGTPAANSSVSTTPFDLRRLVFDPPLIFYPGDPFSIDISNFFSDAAGNLTPLALSDESLSLVVGGYVLYPGEY